MTVRHNLSHEVAAEHAPMWALSELPVHEWSANEMLMEATTDPRAYERYWFTCQDRTGDLFLVTGFGLYPNLGTVEAFSIVNVRGRHTTVRAHRRISRNRLDMGVGPIDFTLVEAFRDWHLSLAQNEYGIEYDLHWYDTKRSVRQPALIQGYETFGRIEGHVVAHGERFEITREAYLGSRDHHWGVRDGVGGPGHSLRPGGTSTVTGGQWVEFSDWSIWLHRILYNLGDPRPGTGRIIRQERRLAFEPDTRIFSHGIVRNTLEGGDVRELRFRRLGNQTAFLRCGMYGGREGGTPDGDIWHGMYVGDNVVSGESYDVNDPGVRSKLAGSANHHCEVTCDGETTFGLFETHDPMTWEMCRDGVAGYALLEE